MEKSFKPIFSSNPNIRKNAYMNWRTDENNVAENMVVLGDGFKDATCVLIKDILNDNSSKQADVLIFPILYSINQSIELYLKAILYVLDTIKPNKFIDIFGHDIRELFDDMTYQIETIKGSSSDFIEAVECISEYIKELYSFIETKKGKPQMEFARYPIDRSNNPYFYIIEKENVVVDIENLLNLYNEMMESLEGVYLECRYKLGGEK